MSNKKEEVCVSSQNTQEVEEVKVPKFVSPFIIKRNETRTINTGNYENVKVDAGIEVSVEISTQEDYNLAVDYLTKWLKEDLDNQEEIIKAKLVEKEEKEKEVEIKQAEEYAEKMKNVPVYVWNIQTNVGTLSVSNDPNFQMRCPRCGRPLEKRNGKFGEFYGCQGYRDETNKCTFGVNKVLLDEFFAHANEVIQSGAPNVNGLTATIVKNGSEKNINVDKSACYQDQQIQQNQSGQYQDYSYESDLPF